MLVFDAHCHVGKWGTWEVMGKNITPFPYEYSEYTKFEEHYLNRYKPDYAVIVPHYLPDPIETFKLNLVVRDFVCKDERLIGGLWINPSPDMYSMSIKVLESYPIHRIKVIKMSPDTWADNLSPDPSTWDDKTRSLMDLVINLAIKHNLVVHFHTGMNKSDPTNYQYFMDQYGKSGAAIQFVHMGNLPGGHFRFVPMFIEWLKRGYNAYCDISWSRGFGPRWLIDEMQKSNLSLDHIFFASDEPWGDYPSEIAKVQNLRISQFEMHNILYQNAFNLYIN